MPGVGHTGFPRGKRVLVILKDGTRFVAKFRRKGDDDRTILFEDHDPVQLRRVRVMSIYRAA